MNNKVYTADSKGRVALGATAAGKNFILEEESDGKICLTPAAVIPEREMWLWQNPAALDAVREGISDAQAGRTVRRSFKEHADLELEDDE